MRNFEFNFKKVTNRLSQRLSGLVPQGTEADGD